MSIAAMIPVVTAVTDLCIFFASATYISLRRNSRKLHPNTQALYRKLLIILIVDVTLGKPFIDLNFGIRATLFLTSEQKELK
jgi:hypothetical protein